MSNETFTYYIDYREHTIFVLCIQWPNGWIGEVDIQKDGETVLPTRRVSHDDLYETGELMKQAGLDLGKRMVDNLIKAASR